MAPPTTAPPEAAARARNRLEVANSPRLTRFGTSSISQTVTIASRHLANWSPGLPLPTCAKSPEAPAAHWGEADAEISGQPPRWPAAGLGASPDTVDTIATKIRQTSV